MTSRDFCYWLQGMFEISDPKELNEKQTELVRRHLVMVFLHEIDKTFPAEQQESLDVIHHQLKKKMPGEPPPMMPGWVPLDMQVRC
jgi:hypothetical protein